MDRKPRNQLNGDHFFQRKWSIANFTKHIFAVTEDAQSREARFLATETMIRVMTQRIHHARRLGLVKIMSRIRAFGGTKVAMHPTQNVKPAYVLVATEAA